jgi:hypothetical protein
MARGFEVTTGLVIQQGVFEDSTIAKHKIGTRMQLADGRVFYYCEAGGALTVGKLVQAVLPTAAFDICALSTEAVGSKEIGVTPNGSPSVAANDFAEGYVVIHTGTTGSGQCRKISSHTASPGDDSEFTLNLYDPFTAIINADATGEVIRNPFKDVTHLGDATGTGVGVPLVNIASGSFGWLQTYGECALLAGSAGEINAALQCAATAGEVITLTAVATTAKFNDATQRIGRNLSVTLTDGSYHATMLTLRP